MAQLFLILLSVSQVCQAGFFPESNDSGNLEWGMSKDSPTSEAEPSPDENLDPEKKENEIVRVKSPKKMEGFLKSIRPEAPLTLVLKNRKSLRCFYSRSNKLGVEVWTDEDFELEGRRAFYYSEIKYIETNRNSFIVDESSEEDKYDGTQSDSKRNRILKRKQPDQKRGVPADIPKTNRIAMVRTSLKLLTFPQFDWKSKTQKRWLGAVANTVTPSPFATDPITNCQANHD